MGIETQLVLGFETSDKKLTDLIQSLIDGTSEFEEEDRRSYFLTGTGGGCYQSGKDALSVVREIQDNLWSISIRTFFKNYGGELEWLLEKIIKANTKRDTFLLGYYIVEPNVFPTLIYSNGTLQSTQRINL